MTGIQKIESVAPLRSPSQVKMSTDLPQSGTFSLWQMMLTIMQYEKTVLNTNAEMQKNWAESLGGKNGLYQHLYDIGVAVGQKESDSLIAGAIGNFTEAGVSGVSLAGTAGKYAFGTRPTLNAAQGGLEDVGKMEGALNESEGGIKLADEKLTGKLFEEPVSEEVKARVSGWADGSVGLENFSGKDAELNKLAAEHAANDPDRLKEIREKISKHKESLQGQKSEANNSLRGFQENMGLFADGIKKGVSGGMSTIQADKAEEKAKASSSKEIQSQVLQQVEEQKRKAEQNAQEAQQQANQWAASFAQAAAAQVHA